MTEVTSNDCRACKGSGWIQTGTPGERIPCDCDPAPSLVVTDETALAIEKFTELSVEHYQEGGTDKAGWEHARSYAVEALQGLLRANPGAFTYKARMDAVSDKRREAKRNG